MFVQISEFERNGIICKAADIYCPGCKRCHYLPFNCQFDDMASWDFNGNLIKPTFSPSILAYGPKGIKNTYPRCHSFLEDGIWRFLSDTEHEFADQKIPVIEIPEEWLRS